ncbi:hypothetical protein V6N11_040228 [Hibiscus sabdariffa]|uniref:MULE transposase domain-containing protein n=1 Tax=Hibiscus sabdariffa TaxID=183260 RepID=A0ABR2RH85_9ROSI
MTLEHDEGNGANVFDEGPGENNGFNGIDESVNEIVGEDSNNIDGDISGSDWVDGDNILSDDDDELASLKNKFNKMTLEHDEGNGANVFDEGPGENNGFNGIDESVNEIVGEDSNNIDGDISGSDWVDGDNILSDDDDELASLKNKFNKMTLEHDEGNGANVFDEGPGENNGFNGIDESVNEIVGEDSNNIDGDISGEDLEPNVALEIIKFSNGLIEEDLGGLGSGEGTEYLDSSDVGSYKTNSDGDVVCKKSGKVFFDASVVEPRFQLGMIFESQQQLKDTLCAYAVAHSFDFRSADPNGTFDLIVERPTDVATPKFRRLYVRFSALKEGFKRFCRPVISLDGCYLKGEIKGEILLALGRDGNNQIFPIAWALVEVENRETWAWFLENIQRDLNLGDGSKFTLISDMQKLHTRAHRYASTSSQLTASSQQHTVVSEPPTTFSQQHTTVSELHAARAPKLTIRRP